MKLCHHASPPDTETPSLPSVSPAPTPVSWLAEHTDGAELRAGRFGLEREALRVTPEGALALTPHPSEFGDKLSNAEITVDFSESQLEWVTPAEPSVDAAHAALAALQSRVEAVVLARGERLWPFSMPPALPADALIPIARFSATAEGRQRELYRTGLAARYGRRMHLISGLHFNLSYGEKLLATLRTREGIREVDRRAWTDAVYFRAARNVLRDRWLLVALTGASPAADPSYRPAMRPHVDLARQCCTGSCACDGPTPAEATSLRVSCHGYADTGAGAMPVSFNSLHEYVRDIRRLLTSPSPHFAGLGRDADGQPVQINDRVLQLEKEFYAPIRLKGGLEPGESHLDAMERAGVRYAEIRLLDVNPFVREGIDLPTLRILQVFMLHCLLGETAPIARGEWDRIEENHVRVALFGRRAGLRLRDGEDVEVTLPELAAPILTRLRQLAALMDRDTPDAPFVAAVDLAAHRLAHPQELPSARIAAAMLQTGETHGAYGTRFLLPQPAGTPGLASPDASPNKKTPMNPNAFDGLELSTQLLAREAVRRGVRVDVLDTSDNFLRLERSGRVELVKQATRTSADTYIAALVMENKEVTKRVLRDAGFSVPAGVAVRSIAEAAAAWPAFAGRGVVVKPRSTNFGEGVTILKEPTWQPDGAAAVERALALDSTVLIEAFIPGREFRFLVIGDETVAVLHRIPANVTGDGDRSIRALVEEKNQDPRRGSGYITPLEKIQLGPVEQAHLQAQGLTVDSVPAAGEVVLLRENSNISTGGDSIDFTDEVHPGYRELAVRAAQAVGARISGADIIIPDITVPPTPERYSIIELNFNPALHIHAFPYRGIDRKAEGRVLDLIGFPEAAEDVMRAPAATPEGSMG